MELTNVIESYCHEGLTLRQHSPIGFPRKDLTQRDVVTYGDAMARRDGAG